MTDNMPLYRATMTSSEAVAELVWHGLLVPVEIDYEAAEEIAWGYGLQEAMDIVNTALGIGGDDD